MNRITKTMISLKLKKTQKKCNQMGYKCLNLEAAAKFITGSGKNKTMFFSQYPLDAGTKTYVRENFNRGES